MNPFRKYHRFTDLFTDARIPSIHLLINLKSFAGCLPSLHRWCSCGADGVKSGGKYGQYRQSNPHMYDMIDSIPPYIRYGHILRALDFPLNQLVQGSSPWRIIFLF